MTNLNAARRIVTLAAAHGIDTWCVCAGSRNSPLLAVLGQTDGVRLYSFVDERSAAFFALGRAKRNGRPVGIVTTSGTAVAELLPAVVEAFYARVPLLLVTADRPARYRGTGAPQAIEQPGIFGGYVERSLDLDAGLELEALEWHEPIPLHLNVAFDEPLIDGELTRTGVEVAPRRAWNAAPLVVPKLPFARPLVLVAGLRAEERTPVREFLLRFGAAVYAEPLSGLREDAALDDRLIANERMLPRGRFDGVIRIGAVPTLRFWRDLDEKLLGIPLIHLSAARFSGLSRGETHTGTLDGLASVPARDDGTTRGRDTDATREADRVMSTRFSDILANEPRSELAMMRALSERLPEGSRIFLGNSLPIREWDLAATRSDRGFVLDANRGANGIDGELSTFFGGLDPARPNVAIVGDLTALYDLNAPWIARQLDARNFRIIVVNNGGGRIFSRVASLAPLGNDVRERIIENAHALHFESWARMFGLPYHAYEELPEAIRVDGGGVIELLPDAAASLRVGERADALWNAP